MEEVNALWISSHFDQISQLVAGNDYLAQRALTQSGAQALLLHFDPVNRNGVMA